MTVRLHRTSNFYRRAFWINCLTLGSLFLLLPLVVLLLAGAFHIWFVLPLLALNLIGFFSLLFGYPGKLELNRGALSYTENYEITKGERKKLHFTVTEMSDVEYLQSDSERKRNVGRIRFRGVAEIEPRAALKDRKISFFEIDGIPNFDQLPALLEEMKLVK